MYRSRNSQIVSATKMTKDSKAMIESASAISIFLSAVVARLAER